MRNDVESLSEKSDVNRCVVSSVCPDFFYRKGAPAQREYTQRIADKIHTSSPRHSAWARSAFLCDLSFLRPLRFTTFWMGHKMW